MSQARLGAVGLAVDTERERSRSGLGDRALLLAAAAGDQGACRELFLRHGARLLDVLSASGADRALAEDAAQEAFLRALGQAESLRDSGAFFPWLVRIALRVRVDLLRKTRRERPTEHQAEVASEEDLERSYVASEDARRVRAVLGELSQAQRELVVLRYFASLSTAELAQVFDKSEVAVRKELQRARDRLRVRLGDWFTKEGA